MIFTLLILNFDQKVLSHSFDFPLLDHRACTSDAATMANTVQMSAVSTYDACLSFETDNTYTQFHLTTEQSRCYEPSQRREGIG